MHHDLLQGDSLSRCDSNIHIHNSPRVCESKQKSNWMGDFPPSFEINSQFCCALIRLSCVEMNANNKKKSPTENDPKLLSVSHREKKNPEESCFLVNYLFFNGKFLSYLFNFRLFSKTYFVRSFQEVPDILTILGGVEGRAQKRNCEIANYRIGLNCC